MMIDKNIEVIPSSQKSLESTVALLEHKLAISKSYERELEESKLKAEKSAAAKSNFLANMSHEIRSPLGLILGFTEELVKSNQFNPDNRYLIHTIQSNSKMLERLINDILDFSKVEAGKLDYDVAPINCCHFIDELEVTFKAICADKKLLFHKDILTTLPDYFYSDGVRIKQVLMNLVCNAVKHTVNGGLVLKISYSEPNSLLYFDLIDSGAGIPFHSQADIFQMFKQLNKDSPGCGLGLPLSRNLARGLEGDLKLVRSRPHEGSWFRVEIKNQKNLQNLARLNPEIIQKPCVNPPQMNAWKILVVDDLIDNVRLLDCILRPTKAIVEGTTSASEALQKVKTFKYDLILLDLMMPEMNGFKALDQLRALGFCGEIWAVSAHAMKSDITESLQAGFSQHISKPIDRQDFYQKLQNLMSLQKLN